MTTRKQALNPNGWTLGIDPGGQTTGLVLLLNQTFHQHWLVQRGEKPLEDYTITVISEVNAIITELLAANTDTRPIQVKIEQVVPPKGFVKGHRSPLNPGALIGVSMVYGACLAELTAMRDDDETGRLAEIIAVRPSRHGHTPKNLKGEALERFMRANYPAPLLPSRTGSSFGDIGRHCRSAYDIARYPKGKWL